MGKIKDRSLPSSISQLKDKEAKAKIEAEEAKTKKAAKVLYEYFNTKKEFKIGEHADENKKKIKHISPQLQMQTIIREKVEFLRFGEKNKDITQFILNSILTESRSAKKLVVLLKRMSEWPKEMLPENYNIYLDRILDLLNNKKDLSITQVSIILDSMKILKGGIGKYGIELIQKHIVSFGNKFKEVNKKLKDNKLLTDEDLKKYEADLEALKKQKNDFGQAFDLVDIKKSLTTRNKLKAFEKGNLLSHLDKSWRSTAMKWIQKIYRILTGAQAEYEKKKRARKQLMKEVLPWLQGKLSTASDKFEAKMITRKLELGLEKGKDDKGMDKKFDKEMDEAIPKLVDGVKKSAIIGEPFDISDIEMTRAVQTQAKLKILPSKVEQIKPVLKVSEKPSNAAAAPKSEHPHETVLFDSSKVKGGQIRKKIETLYGKQKEKSQEISKKHVDHPHLLLMQDKKEKHSVKSLRNQFETPKQNNPTKKNEPTSKKGK